MGIQALCFKQLDPETKSDPNIRYPAYSIVLVSGTHQVWSI